MNNGLVNLGNTCYLNSIIQCLFSIDKFRNEMKMLEINQQSLNLILKKLFNDLENGNGNTKELISFIISKGYKGFRIGTQCDSYEILLIIFELLHDECKKLPDWDIYYYCTQTRNKLLSKSRSELKKIYEKEYSHVYKIFGFQMCSTIKNIKKNTIDYNFEYFLSLTLPIDKDKTNLINCLHAFFENEVINDEIHRKYSIFTYPNILIISLKKFDNFNRKINHNVEIPEILDLSYFSINSNVKYKLKAISKHMGNTNGGHYISECKYNNRWYCCNDSHVSEINCYSSENSYCLFFEKI